MNATNLPAAAPLVATPHRPNPGERLLALLWYSKRERDGEPFTWRDVSPALAELFHPVMTLGDSMHHLVAAYAELMADPRFEAGSFDNEPLALLLAPVKGHSSVEPMGPKSLDSSYTVEAFYNAMAQHIFSKLRLSRVDWLRAQAN